MRAYIILFALFLIVITSCNNGFYTTLKANNDTPQTQTNIEYIDERVPRTPLEQRGWSADKRKFYMETQSDRFLDFVVRNFLEKRLTMAMPKLLVEYMYGPPNKSYADSVWIYLDSNYTSIQRVEFNFNDLVIDY